MPAAIVLPARLASTRLPGKLLLRETGRTVLEHTLAQALAAQRREPGLFTRVLVACDDDKLAAVARRAGVEAVLTRPDHPSGTDRIAEAAVCFPEEIVVNLQADEPEVDPEDLCRVARLLADGAGPSPYPLPDGEKGTSHAPRDVPVATLAVPIWDEATWQRANVVKVVVDAQWRALYFSRAPIPFLRDALVPAAWLLPGPDGAPRRVLGLHHLGLYAYRRDFLLRFASLPPSRLEQIEKLEQLRVLEAGFAIRVGLAASHPPGIDTPEDYEAFVARWNRTNGHRGHREH